PVRVDREGVVDRLVEDQAVELPAGVPVDRRRVALDCRAVRRQRGLGAELRRGRLEDVVVRAGSARLRGAERGPEEVAEVVWAGVDPVDRAGDAQPAVVGGLPGAGAEVHALAEPAPGLRDGLGGVEERGRRDVRAERGLRADADAAETAGAHDSPPAAFAAFPRRFLPTGFCASSAGSAAGSSCWTRRNAPVATNASASRGETSRTAPTGTVGNTRVAPFAGW